MKRLLAMRGRASGYRASYMVVMMAMLLLTAACTDATGSTTTPDQTVATTSSESDGDGGTQTTEADAEESKYGGILTFAAGSVHAEESLDPSLARSPSQYVLNTSIYDTLTFVNQDGWTVEPRLAESWEANDTITQWTFSIRPGVTFHDGTPLTADDVVYSLQRAMDPEVGSLAGVRLGRTTSPENIRAEDDLTVVIDLDQPDSLLPQALSFPQMSIVPDGLTDFTLGSAVGTGPFILSSWEPGGIWEAERNPNYWDPELPFLDGIRRVISTEPASAMQAVIAGDFDIAEAVDPTIAAGLDSEEGARVQPLDNAGSFVVVMDGTQEPFDDPLVREAFKLAANRDQVLSTVYGGFGDITSDIPLPPEDPYFPGDLDTREYDPEGARELLAEAGYPDGIEVTLLTGGAMTDLATAYAASAQEAGITVNLEQLEISNYWGVAYLQAPFYMTDWQLFFPPDFLWYTYGSASEVNESKVEVPGIDQAYDAALQTLDPEEQRQHVSEGLELAAENMGHIIPVSADALLIVNERVQGVEAAPIYRFYLRNVYIEE